MVMKPALDIRLTMMILGFPLCFLIPHTREPTEWRGRARGQRYPGELDRELPRGSVAAVSLPSLPGAVLHVR